MGFKVGEQHLCPKCGSGRAKIVWISKDGKTISLQCPTSNINTQIRCDICRCREMNADGCSTLEN